MNEGDDSLMSALEALITADSNEDTDTQVTTSANTINVTKTEPTFGLMRADCKTYRVGECQTEELVTSVSPSHRLSKWAIFSIILIFGIGSALLIHQAQATFDEFENELASVREELLREKVKLQELEQTCGDDVTKINAAKAETQAKLLQLMDELSRARDELLEEKDKLQKLEEWCIDDRVEINAEKTLDYIYENIKRNQPNEKMKVNRAESVQTVADYTDLQMTSLLKGCAYLMPLIAGIPIYKEIMRRELTDKIFAAFAVGTCFCSTYLYFSVTVWLVSVALFMLFCVDQGSKRKEWSLKHLLLSEDTVPALLFSMYTFSVLTVLLCIVTAIFALIFT